MKTIIERKDGERETVEDAYPSFDPDNQTVCGVAEDSTVLTDDVPLDVVARVVWEP